MISCAFRWESIVILQTDFVYNSVEIYRKLTVSSKTHPHSIYLSSVNFDSDVIDLLKLLCPKSKTHCSTSKKFRKKNEGK